MDILNCGDGVPPIVKMHCKNTKTMSGSERAQVAAINPTTDADDTIIAATASAGFHYVHDLVDCFTVVGRVLHHGDTVLEEVRA
jgi:hypothetical protein